MLKSWNLNHLVCVSARFRDEVMLGHLLQPQGFSHWSLVSHLRNHHQIPEEFFFFKCPAIIVAKWTRVDPNCYPVGPPDPNLDPDDQTQPWKSGLLGILLGWTQIWTLFEVNPTRFRLSFDRETPDLKKWVMFGHTAIYRVRQLKLMHFRQTLFHD